MTARTRPPELLEKTLARVSREQGLDQERLRRWVSFLALCGVLERAITEGVLGSYYLKGGVALELRFALRARATKDLDLGLEGNRATRLRVFEDALKPAFDLFTFRLKSRARHMDLADTVRIEVRIQYRTRAWQTIEVDLGPAGATNADLVRPAVPGLAEMGLPVPSPVRCLNLSEQVAQKLHACTSPDATTGRARDIVDILLIEMLGELDCAGACAAAQRVFNERGAHAFPPAFALRPTWRLELESLAAELGFPVTGAAEIERRFHKTIDSIAAAKLSRSDAPL